MNRDTIIEVMARAECVEGGYDPDERMPNDGPRWGYYVPGVTAALSAIEAAGVRLVPVEPTQDMTGAVLEPTASRCEVMKTYRAMLAASPYAPPGG